MTLQEVIQFKKLVEGAYGVKYSDEAADTVWASVLSDELFIVAKKALMTYIGTGSPYHPKLAELKKLCSKVNFTASDIQSPVLRDMCQNGYIGKGIAPRSCLIRPINVGNHGQKIIKQNIELWNDEEDESTYFQRTVNKFVIWEATGQLPDYIKEDMRNYSLRLSQEITDMKLGLNKRKEIEY